MEIKDGFFELKQKFKESGPRSIYISHAVLYEKHPLLRKLKIGFKASTFRQHSYIFKCRVVTLQCRCQRLARLHRVVWTA